MRLFFVPYFQLPCFYSSFEKWHESDDRAAADYRDMLAYYSEEEEKKYGVVGIEFRLVADFVKRRELLSWLNDNKEKDS